MKLRWRLTLLVAGVVVVSVGLAALAAQLAARGELNAAVDDFLRSRSAALVDELRPPARDERGQPRDSGDAVLQAPDSVTQVLNPNGEIIDSLAGAPALPVDADDVILATTPGRVRLRNVEVDGVEFRMITRSTPNGAIQVARELTETNETIRALNVRLAVIGVLGVVLAGIVGWIVGHRVARPVERLASQARYVASTEDLNASVAVDRRDEIGELADSFEAMLVALNRSKEEQQRLVQDVSHELRTPLTSIRTNVEVLQRRLEELDPSERQVVLDELNLEVVELSSLVSELVDLATDISGLADLTEPADLAEISARVAARLGNDHEVVVTGDPTAPIECRPADIERALTNLVANAAKFSPSGTRIEIRVTGSTVEVLDEGPGIPESELGLIFDRFHRADTTRALPGSGLGLAIVARIVEQHSGVTSARNRSAGGAAVGFRLLPDAQVNL